jgi:uncharacterized LabA/DUF88 family protein
MIKLQNNYAFIDSQNVNLAIRDLGWKLDYKRFRVYLKEKYSVDKAFMFLGYVEGNTTLYTSLKNAGFICVFKPTVVGREGKTKGNCDAELVLHAMIEYRNYDQAVIVTGDGDFYCLVEYLLEQNKLRMVVVPNQYKHSSLLKRRNFLPYLQFLNGLRKRLAHLEHGKKRPYKDGTL